MTERSLTRTTRAARLCIAAVSTGCVAAAAPDARDAFSETGRNPACIAAPAPSRPAPGVMTRFDVAESQAQLPLVHQAYQPGIALDADGDGDDDLLVMESAAYMSIPYSGTARVLRNDGGRLSDASAELLATPFVPDNATALIAEDFTGDGRRDLFVAQYGDEHEPTSAPRNVLLVAGGAGQGLSDESAMRFPQRPAGGRTLDAAAADVDCDGDVDLVEVNRFDPGMPLLLHLNQGKGTFTTIPLDSLLERLGIRSGFFSVALADVDSDGDRDLLLGAWQGKGTAWDDAILVNDGFGRFDRGSEPLPRLTFSSHTLRDIAIADFDGDGRSDVLITESQFSTGPGTIMHLLTAQSGGGFTDRSESWGLPGYCAEVIQPTITDLNDDRWPDVILSGGCGERGPRLLFNRGGSFTTVTLASIDPRLADRGSAYGPPIPVDLDGDRQRDLFIPGALSQGTDTSLVMRSLR